jgi:hypothetical protein
LTGVFDVFGVVYDGWLDSVPIFALFVESVGFVLDASGFETSLFQVVATPRVDVKSERQCLGEFARLYYSFTGFEAF